MTEPTTDRRPYALVVDDEVLIRMLAIDILEDAGFRSYEADSVERAMAILHKHHASIVLLFTDVEINGLENGFVLARKTAELWPDIGILVASGRIKPGPTDMPAGAHFVGKPFNSGVVQDRIKQLLPNDRKPDPLKG